MITIALDVMGFENDISEAINASRKFVKKYLDCKIILVGNELEINKLLKNKNEFTIVNSTDDISQIDNPLIAMRKKNSSMHKAVDLVINGEADCILSAGSTAAFVLITYTKFGLIKNISKPAFTPLFPTLHNKVFCMLDVGANKTCDAKDLVSFAIMGSIYFNLIFDVEKPVVKLLNIGTEETKGLDHIIEANNILKTMPNINYQGYIEPRNLLYGETDIAVTDGFYGNLVLKSLEGAIKVFARALKNEMKKPYNWLGAALSYFTFRGVKKKFDYKNNAGALVLGLNKIAVKTHGSADAKQFYSSLTLAYNSVKKDVVNRIKRIINEEAEGN